MSVRRLAAEWNAFAARDPLWAILTWPDKVGGGWGRDEFFATGEAEVAEVLALTGRHRPALATRRALDFGCGVGRLTQALATRFDEVHGVDVSRRMIDLARGFDRSGAVRYHLNEAPDLGLFGDADFDFVYSSLTLQHVPPGLARGYLRELARVLAPGGVLAFQLPERPVRARSSKLRRAFGRLASSAVHRWRTLRNRWRGEPTMDMHGVPRESVEALLRRCGCKVFHVESSTMAGPDWTGHLYLAERLSG